MFAGRSYVIPDDVRDLVFPLLNHRLVLRPGALARESPRDRWLGPIPRIREVILAELAKTPVPRQARADTWGRP